MKKIYLFLIAGILSVTNIFGQSSVKNLTSSISVGMEKNYTSHKFKIEDFLKSSYKRATSRTVKRSAPITDTVYNWVSFEEAAMEYYLNEGSLQGVLLWNDSSVVLTDGYGGTFYWYIHGYAQVFDPVSEFIEKTFGLGMTEYNDYFVDSLGVNYIYQRTNDTTFVDTLNIYTIPYSNLDYSSTGPYAFSGQTDPKFGLVHFDPIKDKPTGTQVLKQQILLDHTFNTNGQYGYFRVPINSGLINASEQIGVAFQFKSGVPYKSGDTLIDQANDTFTLTHLNKFALLTYEEIDGSVMSYWNDDVPYLSGMHTRNESHILTTDTKFDKSSAWYGLYIVTLAYLASFENEHVVLDWHVAPIGVFFDYTVKGCAVEFVAASNTGVDSWKWTFGDGTSSFQQNPTHSYQSGLKEQEVCLTGTNLTTGYKYVVCKKVKLDSIISSVTNNQAIKCYGNSSGSIIVKVNSKADSPYTFLWNGASNQNDSVATGLSAGDYQVIVTDLNGCIDTAYITITEPDSFNISIISDSSAYQQSTGYIDLTITGGVAPYKYLWNNNATTQDIDSLSAGTYIVNITDNNNCNDLLSITIYEPTFPCDSLQIITTSTNITCYGKNDGTASVSAYGSNAPFTYSWSNGNTARFINNLSAGIYIITVTDSTNCFETDAVIITEPDSFNIIIISDSSVYQQSTGYIDLTITGGITPYKYLWSNSAASQDIDSLSAGTYIVYITDNNNCKDSLSITIYETTSIQNLQFNIRNFNLYPNPNIGTFTIQLDLTLPQNIQISMANLKGQIIYSENINNIKHYKKILNLFQQTKGIYIISVKTQWTILTRQIVYE